MKLKRLLTAALSAVMALGVCAMPAMADEAKPVWSQTEGSITIHKYEFNGTGNTPTGEDNQAVPEGAVGLDGVTFHLYQVHDQQWLEDYYSGLANTNLDGKNTTDTDLTNVDNYIEWNADTNAYTLKGNYVDKGTQVTSSDTATLGEAKFDKLPLGLYLVVETDAPDKVTTRTAPFLVSVPMTRIGSTNPLQDWLYDVHVYPKNKTTYGGLTIVKKGKVGNNAETPLDGVTFVLQKKNSDDTWTTIEENEKTHEKFNLTTANGGKISIEGLSQGTYRIYEESYATNEGYILDQRPLEFTVDSTGKITYKNAAGQDVTGANVEISITNEKPDLTKEVYNTDKKDYDQTAQYGVGDTVSYQITVTIPTNITKLNKFTVTDTPKNVKYSGITSVTYADGTGAKDVATTAYGVDDTKPENGFTMTFKPANMADYAGKTITITYTGVVQESAIMGDTGNVNTARLDYSNKIDVNGDPVEGEGNENHIEDSATVYTFGIKLVKIAGEDSHKMAGVEFDLYKQVEAGKIPAGMTAINNADELKLPTAEVGNVWVKVNKTPLTTNTDGEIKVDRMANGDYYLVETKTLTGYNLLKEPYKVTLHVQETTTWSSSTTTDANGNVIKHEESKKTVSFTGDDTSTPTIADVTVVNRKGFNLPVTGGFGTLLFSGIGVLLVLAGVSVLFSLKKKNTRA